MPESNQPSRITLIDALRGFALAGVAIAHMNEQYIAGPIPPALMAGINGTWDNVAAGLVQFFIVGKFFALFSILFGLSFSIQMDSAARRGGDFSLRFLWRALLLLGIGYLHHLFYRGDILLIYGLLAPFLIPFYRVSTRWLLGIALVCLIGLPRFLVHALNDSGSLFGLPPGMVGPGHDAYFAAIQSGSLAEVFALNAVYGLQVKLDYQVVFSGRLFQTFGYFLFGLWLGRAGVFRAPEIHRPRFRKILIFSPVAFLLSGVLGGVAFTLAPRPVDFTHWQHYAALNFIDWANMFMALLIGAAFMVLYQKARWQKLLQFFAPYGRMALTNYILQTLIGTALLYGWGLGLVGQIPTLHLLLLSLCLIGLQCVLSKYWLRAFRYGPLEWAWRSGTYLTVQPFSRFPLTRPDQRQDR